MKRFFFQILSVFTVSALLSSCSEYSKVLKEKDSNIKYTKAVEYYDAGEYYKALPIFEELLGITRGTQLDENVHYYYAKCSYGIKDYYLSNYYFKTFHKTFTNSPKAEECLFLAALCSYNLSPEFSLDQLDTKTAVDQFQLFLDKYPSSQWRDTSNYLVSTLNSKLEKKDFEIAKQYYNTVHYQSASVALKHFIEDYPNSPYRAEALMLIVKSYYLFAEGSIASKKLERYRSSIESYITFASAYPTHPMLKEAEVYYEKSRKEVERLTVQKPTK